MSQTHILFTDGGSRGNPGPAGCGFVIMCGSAVVETGHYFLGAMTNNQAEYYGCIAGLRAAQIRGVTHIILQMDSELVIRQLQGIYRVRDSHLKLLCTEAQSIARSFEQIQYISIPRALNSHADSLANQAMDDRFPLYEALGSAQLSMM